MSEKLDTVSVCWGGFFMFLLLVVVWVCGPSPKPEDYAKCAQTCESNSMIYSDLHYRLGKVLYENYYECECKEKARP